jgi:archaellum component FlaC
LSTLGDALKALKTVLLIEENVSRLQQDVGSLSDEVRRIRDYAAEIDKRVVRIETMIEMTTRSPRQAPQLGIEER